MTIRTHLADLKDQRGAYVRLLEALESGRLTGADPGGQEARLHDLRRKIAELDAVIVAETAKPRPR